MTFGPKRGHPLFIFESFFKDFGPLALALLIGFFAGDMSVIYENVYLMAVVLLGPVGRMVQYLCTRYTVDTERLLVESGWLKKRRLEIPLSTITTVDLSQNLLHQVFGACRLNVDNAGNMAGAKTRVSMTFGREDALAVRELLMAGRKGLDGFNLAEAAAETEEAVHRMVCVKGRDLLLMGALKSKGVFLAELIGLVSAIGLSGRFYEMLGQETGLLIHRFGLLPLALTALAAGFVLAALCGMIGTLIRYYGFRVLDNGQAIKIEYGLLTKKRYTIQKNRISGFSYSQPLLMRLFHTGTLQLFAIGYGGAGDEEAREEPMLFPLIKEERVRPVISEILPEMGETKDYYRPSKGSLRYFFYGLGFAAALAAWGACVWFSVREPVCRDLWALGLLLPAYSVCGRILEYRHNAMYAGERNFSMRNGGFQTHTVFVKTSHMENVEAGASRWKERKGIVSVKAGYIAPLSSAHMRIKNLPRAAFEEARDRLVY